MGERACSVWVRGQCVRETAVCGREGSVWVRGQCVGERAMCG